MIAWAGTPTTSLFPLRLAHAWAPLCVPLLYAAACAAWGQPAGRFVQVTLLNTYIVLQASEGRSGFSLSDSDSRPESGRIA